MTRATPGRRSENINGRLVVGVTSERRDVINRNVTAAAVPSRRARVVCCLCCCCCSVIVIYYDRRRRCTHVVFKRARRGFTPGRVPAADRRPYITMYTHVIRVFDIYIYNAIVVYVRCVLFVGGGRQRGKKE